MLSCYRNFSQRFFRDTFSIMWFSSDFSWSFTRYQWVCSRPEARSPPFWEICAMNVSPEMLLGVSLEFLLEDCSRSWSRDASKSVSTFILDLLSKFLPMLLFEMRNWPKPLLEKNPSRTMGVTIREILIGTQRGRVRFFGLLLGFL